MNFRLIISMGVLPFAAAAAENFGDSWGTAEREAAYYRIVNIPLPEGVYLDWAAVQSVLPSGQTLIVRGENHGVTSAFQ